MDFPKELILPPLPFGLSDLEPVIGRKTIEAHYFGHHKGYVDKYNILIKERGNQEDLQFNYNGHLLHTLYWNSIKPEGPGGPVGKLKSKLRQELGSDYENILKIRIIEQCLKVKGSGWIVLAFDPPNNKMTVRTIYNHSFEDIGNLIPLLVIDLWEHSYYLDYQFNRSNFIYDFYKLLNWNTADIRLAGFIK